MLEVACMQQLSYLVVWSCRHKHSNLPPIITISEPGTGHFRSCQLGNRSWPLRTTGVCTWCPQCAAASFTAGIAAIGQLYLHAQTFLQRLSLLLRP